LHFYILFCVAGFFITFLLYNHVFPVNSENTDFFAGREPSNITLEKWANKYWQWWATIQDDNIKQNASTHLDTCIIHQDKDGMIFLLNIYDMKYRTKCTISSEYPILIPLLIGECDPTVEEIFAKSGNIQDLQTCAMLADEIFKAWEVALNGKVIFKKSNNEEININLKDMILVRNNSPFILNIPSKNSWDVIGGNYTAVTDGYYLPIKPLTPGEHKLEYKIIHQSKSGTAATTRYIIGEGTYFLKVN